MTVIVYDPTAKISEHFTMAEVAASETATRKHIVNIPSSEVLVNAATLALHVLEPIRTHFGIPFKPNSWYRGEALEYEINAVQWKTWAARQGLPINDATWKQYFARKSHPLGQAVDIEIPGISNDELCEWIDKNIKVYDQLIREFAKPGDPTSGWVHVSYSVTKNRHQRFTINQ